MRGTVEEFGARVLASFAVDIAGCPDAAAAKWYGRSSRPSDFRSVVGFFAACTSHLIAAPLAFPVAPTADVAAPAVAAATPLTASVDAADPAADVPPPGLTEDGHSAWVRGLPGLLADYRGRGAGALHITTHGATRPCHMHACTDCALLARITRLAATLGIGPTDVSRFLTVEAGRAVEARALPLPAGTHTHPIPTPPPHRTGQASSHSARDMAGREARR